MEYLCHISSSKIILCSLSTWTTETQNPILRLYFLTLVQFLNYLIFSQNAGRKMAHMKRFNWREFKEWTIYRGVDMVKSTNQR